MPGGSWDAQLVTIPSAAAQVMAARQRRVGRVCRVFFLKVRGAGEVGHGLSWAMPLLMLSLMLLSLLLLLMLLLLLLLLIIDTR